MSERYCILGVDDDVNGLEARAALLEEEGYSVTCPLRTLEFDATKFRLALLDFAMPNIPLSRRNPLEALIRATEARLINQRYLNALQLSTKGHLCLRSQELQGK
jgi:CheY-like chemotaxis protein